MKCKKGWMDKISFKMFFKIQKVIFERYLLPSSFVINLKTIFTSGNQGEK